MVEQVAEVIANFNPWWMVAVAIALILLDWLLVQTEAFMTIGAGTLILAIINALDFSPIVQLWSYPIIMFVAFFLQRKFAEVITKAKTPYDSLQTMGVQGLQVHVGEIGTLKILSNKDESSEHFFSYKDSLYQGSDIDSEKRTETTLTAVTKVLLSDGSTHPSKFIGDSEMRDGLRIRVTGVSNGALMVEEETQFKD